MTHLPSDIDMNDIRGKFPFFSKSNSRNMSISLRCSFIPYYEHIKINNNLPDVNLQEPVNSSQLSYKNKEKDEE